MIIFWQLKRGKKLFQLLFQYPRNWNGKREMVGGKGKNKKKKGKNSFTVSFHFDAVGEKGGKLKIKPYEGEEAISTKKGEEKKKKKKNHPVLIFEGGGKNSIKVELARKNRTQENQKKTRNTSEEKRTGNFAVFEKPRKKFWGGASS